MFCRAFIKCPPTILVDVRAVTFLTGESKLQKTLRFFIRYDVTWVGSFYCCSKTDNLLNLMKKLQQNIVCFSTSLFKLPLTVAKQELLQCIDAHLGRGVYGGTSYLGNLKTS